jgi:hypothetical protein
MLDGLCWKGPGPIASQPKSAGTCNYAERSYPKLCRISAGRPKSGSANGIVS